jgi:hypothetical protein
VLDLQRDALVAWSEAGLLPIRRTGAVAADRARASHPTPKRMATCSESDQGFVGRARLLRRRNGVI